jgi:hypothetical protein
MYIGWLIAFVLLFNVVRLLLSPTTLRFRFRPLYGLFGQHRDGTDRFLRRANRRFGDRLQFSFDRYERHKSRDSRDTTIIYLTIKNLGFFQISFQVVRKKKKKEKIPKGRNIKNVNRPWDLWNLEGKTIIIE